MIMKRNLSTLVGLLVSMVMTAAPISQDAARQKALQFLNERGSGVAAARGMNPVKLQLKDGPAADQLYVFNVGQKDGFVIVSGDDCTGDLVLGYAEKGEITAENMPANLKSWLQGYADQIQWMKEHGVKNRPVAEARGGLRKSKASISPLLTTKWNQLTPYNKYCPDMTNNGTLKSATGCVATATAQLMYYQATKHDIPSTTTPVIPGYEDLTEFWWYINGVQTGSMPDKPAITIDWTKIAAEAYPSTDDAKEQVARLMEYIGAGVQMQYRHAAAGGSSASNESATTALINYFGYDPDAKNIYAEDYTYDGWVDAIYAELSTNGPVLFGGDSPSGGHAFIIDGYDYDDFFWVNWGWGGQSDGSFKLSVMNPPSQGTGGSAGGYSLDQVALVNVSPVDDGNDLRSEGCLTVANWNINHNTAVWSDYYSQYYHKTGSDPYQSLNMDFSLINFTGWSLAFEWGVALYQGETLKEIVYQIASQPFSNYMNRYGTTNALSLATQLADGEYRLIAVCRQSSTSAWRPCIGIDKYFVKAVVSDNKITFYNYPAIEYYDANGTLQVSDDAASITVPSTALAVDLTKAVGVTSVTPNSNPNTLYFVGSNVPSGLTGKNVIQNGTCATLTLTDGNDFYSPVDFTATKATYTRQFTQAATGTAGWSTIVVPFNVTSVKQGSKVLDWFRNGSDTGKHFWLKQFNSDGVGTVNFSYATAFTANTPYIIAVPGNSYGAGWDLTNKNITFEGNGTVKATANTSVSKTNYEFIGMLAGKSVTGYVLNAAGSQFKNTTATVDPFRAYFKSVGSGSLGSLAIGSDDGETTGIKAIDNEQLTIDNYYDLQGRQVATPTKGLYIIGGKKVVVK